MPTSVVLTPDQITYLTEQMNASGAQQRPNYVFASYEAFNTRLNTVVKATDNSGWNLPESVHTPNGWERSPGDFKQAVADAIYQTNKDWGPF